MQSGGRLTRRSSLHTYGQPSSSLSRSALLCLLPTCLLARGFLLSVVQHVSNTVQQNRQASRHLSLLSSHIRNLLVCWLAGDSMSCCYTGAHKVCEKGSRCSQPGAAQPCGPAGRRPRGHC